MLEIVKQDLFRITGRNENSFGIFKALFKPEFLFVLIFRYSHQTYNKKNKIKWLFFKILLRHFSIKYGYEIEPQCKIGKGIRLVHRGGVIINPAAQIGNNCTVFRGVTIGSQRRGINIGSPIIGNHVWIGANAVIVGGIVIGDNVLIAPNSYINFNVPNNSICIGNPAKVIKRENATEGYIDFPVV